MGAIKQKCSKCGKWSMHTRKDRYCVTCRRSSNVKKAGNTSRADSYYWNVTVPKLQARFNKKYPIKGAKMGVYSAMPMVGPDNASYAGMVYNRMEPFEE